jgi:hypothetical protein
MRDKTEDDAQTGFRAGRMVALDRLRHALRGWFLKGAERREDHAAEWLAGGQG